MLITEAALSLCCLIALTAARRQDAGARDEAALSAPRGP
jgi:hypothetical protein